MTPEHELPTIRDLRDRMSELIDQGFGDLPVQLVVAPDTTLQAIARAAAGEDGRPALMIDLAAQDAPRLPVGLISVSSLKGVPPMKRH